MRRIHQMAAIAAVAFAAHGFGVREADAKPRKEVASSQASPDAKKHRHRVVRKPKPVDTTEADKQPVFLSDAWLKQEKLTDDKLKRFMNICKGC